MPAYSPYTYTISPRLVTVQVVKEVPSVLTWAVNTMVVSLGSVRNA